MAREPLLRRLVGSILRARREAQGRTLRDVATDARVSVAYLSEIERGRKEASSEVLVAVCGALGMGLADLLADAHRTLVGHAQVVDLTALPGRTSGGTLHVLQPVHAPGPTTGTSATVLLRAA
ncbi:helix-turn-helix domain-containing protein [Cellulomonas sp. 179-A 4D5 NHS]|uniref:helix-turn-helix domain-containing protein n=1 Tax=Cellulomonas sp. 179-A 4D5 NHS TaxID=3142378 RepID=UPI00399F413E